jgi:hypothetical protein
MRATGFTIAAVVCTALGSGSYASGQEPGPPTIRNVVLKPDSGVLTISGTGLGPDLLVTVDGDPMTVLPGARDTQVEVMAPTTLLTMAGTYRLTVADPARQVGDSFIVASSAARLEFSSQGASTAWRPRSAEQSPPTSGQVVSQHQVPDPSVAAVFEGDCKTALGINAAYSTTTGCYVTAVGYTALALNTTGSFNTAVGDSAMGHNNIGSGNTAIGSLALWDNRDGINNTASGAGALQYNTTGHRNTATGWSALSANTTGAYNVASGELALLSNTSGNSNTATGTWALQFNTTGGINTATGVQALWNNTTGIRNTATGGLALAATTTGQQNTATGAWALSGNTTGHSNAALGYNAGANATTGSYNVYVGADVVGTAAEANTMRLGLPYSNGTGQNRTFIAGIYGTQLTGSYLQVIVDANGKLGTLTPPVKLSGETAAPLSVLEQQVQAQQAINAELRATIAELRARLAQVETLLQARAKRQ